MHCSRLSSLNAVRRVARVVVAEVDAALVEQLVDRLDDARARAATARSSRGGQEHVGDVPRPERSRPASAGRPATTRRCDVDTCRGSRGVRRRRSPCRPVDLGLVADQTAKARRAIPAVGCVGPLPPLGVGPAPSESERRRNATTLTATSHARRRTVRQSNGPSWTPVAFSPVECRPPTLPSGRDTSRRSEPPPARTDALITVVLRVPSGRPTTINP